MSTWDPVPEFRLSPEPFPLAAEAVLLAHVLDRELGEDPCSPSPSPSITAPTISPKPLSPGPGSGASGTLT